MNQKGMGAYLARVWCLKMLTTVGIIGFAPGFLVAQHPNRNPASITLEYEPENRGFVYFGGFKEDETPTRNTIADEMLTSRNAAWPTCVAFSPDGRTIAFGDGPWRPYCRFPPTPSVNENGGVVRIVDAKTRRLIRTLQLEKREGHEYRVHRVEFSSDGKSVISNGDDQTYIKNKCTRLEIHTIWDLSAGQIRFQSLKEWDWSTLDTTVSPDGKSIAVPGKDGKIRLKDIAKGLERSTIAAPVGGGQNLDLAFSPDSRILATGCENSGIWFWDAGTGRELGRVAILPKDGFHYGSSEFAFQRDGLALACLNGIYTNTKARDRSNSEVAIYDVHKREEVLKIREDRGTSFRSLAWSPDGMVLAIACYADSEEGQAPSGWIRIWDRVTQKTRDIGRGDFGFPEKMLFSTDSKVLAVTGSWPRKHDESVILLEVSTGRTLASLNAEGSLDGLEMALSPDGQTLATAGFSLMLWDLRNIATSP